MQVKEAIKILSNDIFTLKSLIGVSEGEILTTRKNLLRNKEIILSVYETVDPEALIIVADENVLITLSEI